MPTLFELGKRFVLPTNSHRYAQLEGPRGCNRDCGYCGVPSQWDKIRESSLAETFRSIDFIYNQGFRLLTYIGGEPLATEEPYLTKEGLTFYQHTLQVVRYAHEKGMVVGVVTNADFANEQMIQELSEAGLDSISFSIHSLTKQQLDERIQLAQIAARAKIVPAINVVLTTRTADIIPGIAAYAAGNGIPFSFGLVQEKGGGFSKKNKGSMLPTVEEQEKVFSALFGLKMFGFVRPSMEHMKNATDYYPNNWNCNHATDSFIHIDAVGNVNVCQDVRTGIKVGEINSLSDTRWRETKKVLVRDCGNCLYQCYYDAQNPDPIGHIPYAGVAMLIKAGKADAVEKWGKVAVELSRRMERNANWNLKPL